MNLSKRTQYGLRAMICLADAYNRGYLQTKSLAGREELPVKFLESILSALTRGGFLDSKIGASGGYRLARHPKDIRIGEIVARLEGRRLVDEPAPPLPTERPGEAAVRIVETRLAQALHGVLDATNLAALAEQVGQQAGGQMYYI